MRYRIWMPRQGSVNGRSMVDPDFQEDMDAALYYAVTSDVEPKPKGPEALESIYQEHQNGIQEITGTPTRNPAGVRSLSVGDLVQDVDRGEWWMVSRMGFTRAFVVVESGTGGEIRVLRVAQPAIA